MKLQDLNTITAQPIKSILTVIIVQKKKSLVFSIMECLIDKYVFFGITEYDCIIDSVSKINNTLVISIEWLA